MPKGPKGEYRPRDALQSGIITMKIALGLMTEEDARKLAPKRKAKKTKKRRISKAPAKKGRIRKT